jgi:hypothetical protein
MPCRGWLRWCRSPPSRRPSDPRPAGGGARGDLWDSGSAGGGARSPRQALRFDDGRLARDLGRSAARAQAPRARRRRDADLAVRPRDRLAALLAARGGGLRARTAAGGAVPAAGEHGVRTRRRVGRAVARGCRRPGAVARRGSRRRRPPACRDAEHRGRPAVVCTQLAASVSGPARVSLRSRLALLAAPRRDRRARRGRAAGARAQRLPSRERLPARRRSGRDRLGVLRNRRAGRRRGRARGRRALRRVLPGRGSRASDRSRLGRLLRSARPCARARGGILLLRGQRPAVRLGAGDRRALRRCLRRAHLGGGCSATVLA